MIMMQVRKADTRGHARFDWLDSWHSFSFGHYYDPAHMGFGALRVINDDLIAPGSGFPMHGHQDMEIVTYVLDGALEHRDSLGNHGLIAAGDVQRMRAGRGIRHSEYNASDTAPVRLLQIWLQPDCANLAPGYEQVHIDTADKTGRFRRIASPEPGVGAVHIHQDAHLHAAVLPPGTTASVTLAPGRRTYLQVARGAVDIANYPLKQGDAVKITGETQISVTGRDSADGQPAEVLLFDLA
jgi:redox-sensitive bicupin YhaK (pirin superfamily)